jgi:predicted small secreted protein
MKTLVTLIASLFLLTACNTMEGLGKDIKTAGDSLENAARKNK